MFYNFLQSICVVISYYLLYSPLKVFCAQINRPEAGSNASRPMSSNKLSANRSTSSSGPSSPQNIDLSQSDFNPSILMANDTKPYHQKSYPVVYGELVILGSVLIHSII